MLSDKVACGRSQPPTPETSYEQAGKAACSHCAANVFKEGKFHIYYESRSGITASWGESVQVHRLCMAPDLLRWANDRAR